MITEGNYQINYINIDSSFRNKETTYETEKPIRLLNNPFKVYYDNIKYRLGIHHPGHRFMIGDKIIISGIQYRSIKLRTRITNNSFQFINGSEYLRIFYDDGTESISKDNPNKRNGGLSDIDYDIFIRTPRNYTNLFIRIDGFQGDYIGNIPTNTLNGRHHIYILQADGIFDNRVIYIKLIHPFDGDIDHIFPKSYNVVITFEYICGIPINKISNYQIITYVEKDLYFIDLDEHPTTHIRQFGGDEITISKIININKGYDDPNNYTIYLDKIYSNIVEIGLVSSEFPKIENNKENYILMICNQIQIINSKYNAFAKILLPYSHGQTLFNTYVNTPQYFHNPINKIYKLDIEFRTSEGKLYDFNNRDHSFTLKLVSL